MGEKKKYSLPSQQAFGEATSGWRCLCVEFSVLVGVRAFDVCCLRKAAGSRASRREVCFCFCFHATTTAKPVHYGDPVIFLSCQLAASPLTITYK